MTRTSGQGTLRAAQELTHYSCGSRRYARIPYAVQDRASASCRGCGAVQGELHGLGCEEETCPVCRAGLLALCECQVDEVRLLRGEPEGRAGGILGKPATLILIVILTLFAASLAWLAIRGILQAQQS